MRPTALGRISCIGKSWTKDERGAGWRETTRRNQRDEGIGEEERGLKEEEGEEVDDGSSFVYMGGGRNIAQSVYPE